MRTQGGNHADLMEDVADLIGNLTTVPPPTMHDVLDIKRAVQDALLRGAV